MVTRRSLAMSEALALVAPGEPLRDGLDRILQARRGALVIIGDDPLVLRICTGGFLLDAELTPQRLAELAKMDGAVILSRDASRIARANVHLMPSPSVTTTETGTRHRTAERVARSLEVTAISVSQAMSTVAVYRGSEKEVLQPVATLISRTNEALQTLERFKHRLDEVSAVLTEAEVGDMVTSRNVVDVLQRMEMVLYVAGEVSDHLVELGGGGRLLRLQLNELMDGVPEDRLLLLKDYMRPRNGVSLERVVAELGKLSAEERMDQRKLASVLGLSIDSASHDSNLEPKGYRLLAKIPRFPEQVIEGVVRRFGTLHGVMRATIAELEKVEGVGESRARMIKEGLSRMAEASILDRFS
ncbi:MAG: DNA integrity scanning diadenylate cyclase DisA [Actinomycetota bacterium]|nr:DNA integrity scanning diadenylate cyclase DisA [Actinomycetota bacterium]